MSDPTLAKGERLISSFQGSRTTYIQEHVILAALGSLLMAGGLVMIENPYPWTGVIGAVLAIAARGFYVANEQLGFVFHLTNKRLILPDGRDIQLSRIANIRHIFSAVQVITDSGDKFLIKYQSDTKSTAADIDAARGT